MSVDLYALLTGGPVAPAAGDAVVGLRSGASGPVALSAGPPTPATSVPSSGGPLPVMSDGTTFSKAQMQAWLGITVTSPPTITTNPSISGTAQVGQTLTVNDGAASGGATVSARQWFRDTTAISGANGSTYTAVTADATHTLSCQVTWHGSGGDTVGTSAATSAVTAAGAFPITFTGAAGAPTGNQVLTPWYAALNGTQRDGNGNLSPVSTSTATLGTFQGPGTAPANSTLTVTMKSGAGINSASLLIRASGGTSNYRGYQANYKSDGSVDVYRSTNGSGTTSLVGSIAAGTVPSAPTSLGFSATSTGTSGNVTLTLYVNGSSIGTVTDTAGSGTAIYEAGYVGIGVNQNTALASTSVNVT